MSNKVVTACSTSKRSFSTGLGSQNESVTSSNNKAINSKHELMKKPKLCNLGIIHRSNYHFTKKYPHDGEIIDGVAYNDEQRKFVTYSPIGSSDRRSIIKIHMTKNCKPQFKEFGKTIISDVISWMTDFVSRRIYPSISEVYEFTKSIGILDDSYGHCGYFLTTYHYHEFINMLYTTTRSSVLKIPIRRERNGVVNSHKNRKKQLHNNAHYGQLPFAQSTSTNMVITSSYTTSVTISHNHSNDTNDYNPKIDDHFSSKNDSKFLNNNTSPIHENKAILDENKKSLSNNSCNDNVKFFNDSVETYKKKKLNQPSLIVDNSLYPTSIETPSRTITNHDIDHPKIIPIINLNEKSCRPKILEM